MPKNIEFTKYKERGAYHWQESQRSVFKFNAYQEARFEWILRCLGDIKGKKVLDVACGDGALAYRIAKRGADVTGFDNSEEAIKLAKEIFNKKKVSAQLTVANAYKIPVRDNSIDCVVLGEIIEHVSEPEKILSETQRVLKSGGRVVISTPCRLSEIPWDEFHIKEYYPNELKSLLVRYFSDIEIIETHPLFWVLLYCCGVPWFREREIFRWLINILVLYFKFNPFLRNKKKHQRFDCFAQITAIAYKK